MHAEITAAIATARTALTLAKSAHELSNFNELISAVSEVNIKLVDALAAAVASLEKQSALTGRIADLEKELREKNDWDIQIKRYDLYEFPATKALAYALNPAKAAGEPPHYLCATCLNKHQKTILQPNGKLLYCPVCNKTIATQFAPPKPKRVRTTRPSWLDR